MQALNRPRHCHVGDPEPTRQIDHPRLTGRGDQLRDNLDIILRDLLRMLFPRPAWMAMWKDGAAGAGFGRLGGGWRHSESKTKERFVDNRKIDL